MKKVERYVAKSVLGATALVTLMLTGLQIFILLVNLLDDLGKGQFSIMQAIIYVLLQLPYQVYLFFPMACLLGCLIGLGIMGNHRELVVMRAAGMSVGQITMAIFKTAAILIIVVTLAGESIIPALARYANDFKMAALSGGQTLRTAYGVWMRHQNDYISIGQISHDNHLINVSQFRFNQQHQMVLSRHINDIELINGQWMAHDVQETLLFDTHSESKRIKEMNWDVSIRPQVLKVSTSEPEEMTLIELKRYIREQNREHQQATAFELSFWQRIMLPITTLVMMMLAIPFIFGPLRSSPMGAKLLAGAATGFSFYIVNKFFGPLSMVYQLPPLIAAVGPTLVFMALGIYLMNKVR